MSKRKFLPKGGCPMLLFYACTCLFSLFMWGYCTVHSRGHSSRSCSASFFCKNDFLSRKWGGGGGEMFCDKIVFINLCICICIYMYINICTRIITLFFQPFACKYCTFHGKGHLQPQLLGSPLFFFYIKPFSSQRQSKKFCDFERKQIVPILLCMYINIHKCIVIFFFLTNHV